MASSRSLSISPFGILLVLAILGAPPLLMAVCSQRGGIVDGHPGSVTLEWPDHLEVPASRMTTGEPVHLEPATVQDGSSPGAMPTSTYAEESQVVE